MSDIHETPPGELPDWWGRGECQRLGVPVDWFFPERGTSAAPAKSICAVCPVIEPCREFGMSQKFGVWGGLSERERRRIRSQRARDRGAA